MSAKLKGLISLAVMLPGLLGAAVTETILAVRVTNYTTGFVIDADRDTNDTAFNREAVRVQSRIEYANSSMASTSVSYRLAFRLLDANDVPHPLISGGVTNTSHTIGTTFTISGGQTRTNTNSVALLPAARLSPYAPYRVQLELFRGTNSTGRISNDTARTYYHFTNRVSDDPAFNVIATLTGASFTRKYAVNTDTSKNGFLVAANFTLRRYDNFASADHAGDDVPITLTCELRDADTGEVIPLKSNSSTFNHNIDDYSPGDPPAPRVESGGWTKKLEPADGVQLDSVNRRYKVVVTISHTEDITSGAVAVGNSVSTADEPLLHFNGRLFFGAIETGFTSIGNNPSILSVEPGSYVNTALGIDGNSGFILGQPAHTYGDGTDLPVRLRSNGNAEYAGAADVAVNGPGPAGGKIAGVSYQRTGITLNQSGAHSTLTVTLPAGFGYRADTVSRILSSELSFPAAALDQMLAPSGNVKLTLPSTHYFCEESKPIWIQSRKVQWTVSEGRFVLTPAGPLVYVRGAELAELEASPVAAADKLKRSNEQYWRYAGLPNAAIEVRAAEDMSARLSADVNLAAPGVFVTHFPYDVPVAWNGAGRMVITDDLIVESADSRLSLVNDLALSFSSGCDGCPGEAERSIIQFGPESGELRFTRDGGLMAQGESRPEIELRWGAITAPAPTRYAQTVSNLLAAAFHMPGICLRGDQTTNEPNQRTGVILLTGVGSGPDGRERPETDAYADGLADYGGLNFRVGADGAHDGESVLAGVKSGPYDLKGRSKYYARYAGVSGIHEAVRGSFPTSMTLYGYQVNFDHYGLSYLDSTNFQSVTEGSIVVPDPVVAPPSGFTQEFAELRFNCLGGLLDATVPDESARQPLDYWRGQFLPITIAFRRSLDCNCDPSQGFLVIGAETYANHIGTPLFGDLGFKPNGNFLTENDGGAGGCVPEGLNSRLRLPTRVEFKGPGGETYALHPVTEAYFNNPHNSDGVVYAKTPAAGFLNWAGTLGVAFFEDMQVHLHTTARLHNFTNDAAPIYFMGGWPGHGWDPVGENFFTNPRADSANRGFPDTDAQVASVDDYRNFRPGEGSAQYHPRAKQSWLDVVDFDYPLTWSWSSRSFKSVAPVPDELLVVSVESQVKYLSAQRAELAFGAQYGGLPQLNLANFAFNAVDDALQRGVRQALETALGPLRGQIESGLGRLDSMLNDQMHGFFASIFDDRLGGRIDLLRGELLALTPTAENFLTDVDEALNRHLPTDDLSIQALQEDLTGSRDTFGVAKQVNDYLNDAKSGISAVDHVINDGVGDARKAVLVVQNLISQLAPDQSAAASVNAVTNFLNQLQPTLNQITATLHELSNQLETVQGTLNGDFLDELNDALPLDDINGIVTETRNGLHDFLADIAAHAHAAGTLGSNYSAAEFQQRIRQEIEDQFFASPATANLQRALRQRLYDTDAALREAIDTTFQQFNDVIRDVISQTLAELDNSINEVLGGAINDVMGAGKINGYAHINGDALRELRLDGHFQFKVPEDMELNAFLRIRELDSDGTPGCYEGYSRATEVTLGATDVNLDWISPDLRADVTTKFSFEPGGGRVNLIGLGGAFEVRGALDFETFTIDRLGAALAFGAEENYLAATAQIRFSSYRAMGGIFFGRTCTLDPILLFDPEVARLLGEPADGFTGAYGYVEVWIPISEVYLGIPASCLFRIDAGVGAGVGYFVEGPTYIGKLFAGVSGEALCAVSVRGDITMIGVKQGDDFRFSGSGRIKGKAGACPLCIKFNKTVRMTYQNDSWDVDY